MDPWASLSTDILWRTALAAIPLTLLVAAITRLLPCRPSTRHALWLILLVWLVAAPFLPAAPSLDTDSWLAAQIESGPDNEPDAGDQPPPVGLASDNPRARITPAANRTMRSVHGPQAFGRSRPSWLLDLPETFAWHEVHPSSRKQGLWSKPAGVTKGRSARSTLLRRCVTEPRAIAACNAPQEGSP